MPAATLVSVEEYLETVYRPDCDFIDGEILERNVGEQGHSRVQFWICIWFADKEKRWGIRSLPEARLQVSNRRFRIPDVMFVQASAPFVPIVTTPPVLCIEILSPRDSLSSIWERTQDYFEMGVPFCWIIDPVARRGWVATPEGLFEAKDGTLRAGEIEMPLSRLFDSAN